MTDTATEDPPKKSTSDRVAALDFLRGLAVIGMVYYHGAWDFVALDLAQIDLLGDPYWLAVRAIVLGTFLLLVGINLRLATRDGIRWRSFGRRLAILFAAAALITTATYFALPGMFIYFGVLHHVAVASIICLLLVLTRLWSVLYLVLAGFVVFLSIYARGDPFNADWLSWVGLRSLNPIPTVDYVPLVPWFSIVLVGMAIGGFGLPRWLRSFHGRHELSRVFCWVGRHSLAIYLLHQPVIIALLAGFIWLSGVGSLAVFGIAEPTASQADRGFQVACQIDCEAARADPAFCAPYCSCMSREVFASGLWESAESGPLDEIGLAQMADLRDRCVAEVVQFVPLDLSEPPSSSPDTAQ